MSWLSEFHFNALKQPWLLLLLIPVFLLLVAEIFSRPAGVISVSTGDTLARIAGHRKNLRRHLPAVLRALGLALLIVALARPVNSIRSRIEHADVIDIMLVVDVSGSMTAEDFVVEGHLADRLYVTKMAVLDFIKNREDRSSANVATDRVGLLLYAKHAWIQCPLTLDYGIFNRELERIVIDKNNEKHSYTAIGSAIGLAVSNLSKSEADSKVIILLTDGINNFGNLDPVTAAQLAHDYDLRIYTIGAGSTRGGGTSALGLINASHANPIDEEAMQRIASITGGRYFRATDTESLHEAYAEIDELERTEIEVGESFTFDDAFVPYAVAGALAMMCSIFGRRRWFEAIP